MKSRWAPYAKRIDALTLRERAFLFLSAALVLIALADTLVLSPAMAEQQTLSTRLKQQSKELQALRDQLSAATRKPAPDSPEGRLQAAVAQARTQQVRMDEEIHRRLGSKDQTAQLPELLERTLHRHDRLTLVKLATLPDAPSTAASGSGLHWQGVDLSVAGNYLDLMNYLAELEQALPGLRWGDLSLAASGAPAVMSVRLYLAGEAP